LEATLADERTPDVMAAVDISPSCFPRFKLTAMIRL
jgi:hypothetical protein